jgi:hypothetical protein
MDLSASNSTGLTPRGLAPRDTSLATFHGAESDRHQTDISTLSMIPNFFITSSQFCMKTYYVEVPITCRMQVIIFLDQERTQTQGNKRKVQSSQKPFAVDTLASRYLLS